MIFYINDQLWRGDIQYLNQIGINSLMRESYRVLDPYELDEIASSAIVKKIQLVDLFNEKFVDR